MQIHDQLHNEVLRLTLEAGQTKHIVLLNPHNVQVEVRQMRHSALTMHVVSLDGQDSRIKLSVEQAEEGCELHLYGMGLLQGKQALDTVTRVHHTVGGGSSEQVLKYVLRDEAQGSFYGELKVLPDAQKTEAHQTNRNILLSPTARMRTMPQLEIYADDVKCSHGATTGQLDEQAIFYMQQRGVSRQSAQRLMLAAFLSDVLQGLPDDMREQIEKEIEEKL